ncbi:hypothetical protein WJX72_006798 [[Myrmecia] bisecta]|uniref:Uncharacterized protein n=1 Tax=[Myrmecia] bisecta TaxID=41462 RepID=A0AAW1R885_9CHLO
MLSSQTSHVRWSFDGAVQAAAAQLRNRSTGRDAGATASDVGSLLHQRSRAISGSWESRLPSLLRSAGSLSSSGRQTSLMLTLGLLPDDIAVEGFMPKHVIIDNWTSFYLRVTNSDKLLRRIRIDDLAMSVLKGPGSAPFRIKQKAGDAALFRIDYCPLVAGSYQLAVTCNGAHIADSPFTVEAQPAITTPTKCSASGDGLKDAYIDVKTRFTITTRDQQGNPMKRGGDLIEVEFQGPTKLAQASIRDNDNGTYTFLYSAKSTGWYRVDVRCNGVLIKQRGFHVYVHWGTCSAGQVALLSKPEVQVVAGELCTFTFEARDVDGHTLVKGGDTFEALLLGEGGQPPLAATVMDNGDGTYQGSFRPESAIQYRLLLQMIGPRRRGKVQMQECMACHLTVDVLAGEPYAPACQLSIPPPPPPPPLPPPPLPSLSSTAQQLAEAAALESLAVVAADDFGNRIHTGGAPINAYLWGPIGTPSCAANAADVIDHQDGTYTISYLACEPGTFRMNVRVNFSHVLSSPLSLLVMTEAGASGIRVAASGPGFYKAVAGKTAEFVLTAVDHSGHDQNDDDIADRGEAQPDGASLVPVGRGGSRAAQDNSTAGDSQDSHAGESRPADVSMVILADVVHQGHGSYRVCYEAQVAGMYAIEVLHDGVAVLPGDHKVCVTPGAADLQRSILEGAGGQLAVAGQAAELTLRMVDCFGNLGQSERQELMAMLVQDTGANQGPSGDAAPAAVPCTLMFADTSICRLTYTPLVSGPYSLIITSPTPTPKPAHAPDSSARTSCSRRGGLSLPSAEAPAQDLSDPLRLPVIVYAGPTDPQACLVEGSGMMFAVVGIPARFEVLARDAGGNQREFGGDHFMAYLEPVGQTAADARARKVKATIMDNWDGSYSVTYTVICAGRYALLVFFDGSAAEHVIIHSGGLEVHPALPHAPHCVVESQGLSKLYVNELTRVRLMVHDRFGNPRSLVRLPHEYLPGGYGMEFQLRAELLSPEGEQAVGCGSTICGLGNAAFHPDPHFKRFDVTTTFMAGMLASKVKTKTTELAHTCRLSQLGPDELSVTARSDGVLNGSGRMGGSPRRASIHQAVSFSQDALQQALTESQLMLRRENSLDLAASTPRRGSLMLRQENSLGNAALTPRRASMMLQQENTNAGLTPRRASQNARLATMPTATKQALNEGRAAARCGSKAARV